VNTSSALHLNLDDAWSGESLHLPTLDLRDWGPPLRFSAPARVVDDFYRKLEGDLPSFLVYGSGDFHYLTALWVRRLARPFILISFDNHPDWDVRPPQWGCGGWINRALELPLAKKISVWGCGNFECWWPWQIFGNRRAEREGRLEVHPWADGRSPSEQDRHGAVLRSNWREHFSIFALSLKAMDLYITIDLDCLRAEEAVTNWENGRFTVDDLAWALSELRRNGRIIGGDICGAFSPPQYARGKQRFAATMDHPKLPVTNLESSRKINLKAFETLWPLLAH
jgi:hypothetical protein